MINISTAVHLFAGHLKNSLDLGEPSWTGTMEQFWEQNQEAYPTWGDLRPLLDDLGEYHHAHIGGGAAGAFTICTAAFLAAAKRRAG